MDHIWPGSLVLVEVAFQSKKYGIHTTACCLSRRTDILYFADN